MNQYGLWRVSDLMDYEDPPPRHPVDVLVVEQIDFNNDHNLRFLRFVETPVKPPSHASGSRKRRLGFFSCCGAPRGRTSPERPDAGAGAGADASSSRDSSSTSKHANSYSVGAGGGDSSRSRSGLAVAPVTPSRRNLMGARRFQTPAHHALPEPRAFDAVPEGLLGDGELADESLKDNEGGSSNGRDSDGISGSGGGGGGSNALVEGTIDDSSKLANSQAHEREALGADAGHASSARINVEDGENNGEEALRANHSSTPVSSGLEQDIRVSISSSSSSSGGHSDQGISEDAPSSGLSNTAHRSSWAPGPINVEENHVTKLLFSLFDGAPARTSEGASQAGAESARAPEAASGPGNGSSGDGSSEWFGADPIKWFESLKASAPVSPIDAFKGNSTSGNAAATRSSSSNSGKAPESAPADGIFGLTWPSPFPNSPKAPTDEGWMADMFRLQQSDKTHPVNSPASTPCKDASAAASTPDMTSKAEASDAPMTPPATRAAESASATNADSGTSNRGAQQRSRSVSLASFGSESSDDDDNNDGGQRDGDSSGSEADLVLDASRAAPLQQDALLDSYFDTSSPVASKSQAETFPHSRSSTSSNRSTADAQSKAELSSALEQPAESPPHLQPPPVLTSPSFTRRRMSWAGAEDSFMSPGSSHSAGAAAGTSVGSHSFKSGYGSGLRGGNSRMSSADARPRSSSTATATSYNNNIGAQLPLFPPILPPSSEVNDLLPASVHHLFSSAESRELSVGLAAAHALSSSSASESTGRPSSAPILESSNSGGHAEDLAKPLGGTPVRPTSSTKLRNGSAQRSGSSRTRDEPTAADAFKPINGRSSPVPVT